jgi:hypothetical protein
MDSLWTEYEGERYHVLGIAITDPELVSRTKRVIRCCLGLLVVLIVRTVILLLLDEPIATTALSLLFNLSIPAFGYLGARDGSSTLMCIFVALMFLNAANALAVLGMVAFAVIAQLPQRDSEGTYHPFIMTTSIWLQVILILAWAVMALVAAYHSNKLLSKLSQGEAIAEVYNDDPEIGLPEIDTKLDLSEGAAAFGLPENERGTSKKSHVLDEDFSPANMSSSRRRSASPASSAREMRQLSPPSE